MAKTASLTSSLVAKKGQAAPAVAHEAVDAPSVATKSGGPDYYKSLTVKLDRERYQSLKNIGVQLDKKSQEIFVEALDLWMKQTSVHA